MHLSVFLFQGYACTRVGLNSTEFLCAEGFYCLTGAKKRTPDGSEGYGGVCPIGYYCPEGMYSFLFSSTVFAGINVVLAQVYLRVSG